MTFSEYTRQAKRQTIAEEHFLAALAWLARHSRGAWQTYDFDTLAAGLDWKGSWDALRTVVEVLQEGGLLHLRRRDGAQEFRVEVMPCGHHASALVSSAEGTHCCSACEREARDAQP